MKKFYSLTLALMTSALTVAQDGADSLTFESFDLGTAQYYNGADENGNIVIQSYSLSNSFTPEWQSWQGFSISKVQNITTPGFTNQYASFANGGANNSEKYAIYYNVGQVEFQQAKRLKSLAVTNTTYAALTMRDGDDYTKAFGSAFGVDGQPDGTNGEDWLLLNIIPLDEEGQLVGDTIQFYLADYRFADNSLDYIISQWTTVDLGDVVAKKIAFELKSSDNGQWGMNTPAYFALDNLVTENTALSIASINNESISMYPNPAKGEVTVQAIENTTIQIFNAMGQQVSSQQLNGTESLDISSFSPGVYHVNWSTSTGNGTQRLIIQ